MSACQAPLSDERLLEWWTGEAPPAQARPVEEHLLGCDGCTVSPEDDLLLARLGADLRGVSRLDLVSRLDEGPEERLADLPFDSLAGELLFFPPVDVIRARPASVERVELRSVSPDGERLLGRYSFHHTPWPGPATW